MTPSEELYPWLTVAAIAWGLLDAFLGYKVFKITLAVLGGTAGCVFGHAVAEALGCQLTGQLIGCIAGALSGAGIAWVLYLVAVFLAGFGFGASLAVLLISHFNHMVAMLSGCVLGLVGGFLAIKMQRLLIMLSTALLGAFRAVVASCYFTLNLDWFWYLKNPQYLPALIDTNTWLFPAITALASLGVAVQLSTGRSSDREKDTD